MANQRHSVSQSHSEQDLVELNGDVVSTDSLQRRPSYEVTKVDTNEHEKPRERQHDCQRKLEPLSRQRDGQSQSPQESTLDLSIECCPNAGTYPRHHRQQRERRSRHSRTGHTLRITFTRKASRSEPSVELSLEPHTSPSQSRTGSMDPLLSVSATKAIAESRSVSLRSPTESSTIRTATEVVISVDPSPSGSVGQRLRQKMHSLGRKSSEFLSNWARKAGKVAEKSKQSWGKLCARPRDGGGGGDVKAGGSRHEANKTNTIRRVERRHGSCVVVRGARI